MKYLLALMVSVFLIGCNPTSYESLSRSSVMITTLNGLSGGSGVIFSSYETYSIILTNKHVCEVIKYGGSVVTNDNQKYFISLYKFSKIHDLCLIQVNNNLKINSKLSITAPKPGEPAYIVGHPNLLPTTITEGHFSGHQTIEVLVGIKPCTSEHLTVPEAILCVFMGGIPDYKAYDSQVVSALIKPGSSGSPVYNSRGEIAGLVFAGSGDIGFAFVVPYEYIDLFLTKELNGLDLLLSGEHANE
jgi:S1-C subfamily serine protease